MKTRDIIVFVAIMLYAAVRLYMKYGKKAGSGSDVNTKTNADSAFSSSTKDDDYEPYSKK